MALIAAENEKAAIKAMKLIKVKYEVLEPVLDFHTARTILCLFTQKRTGFRRVLSEVITRRNLVASGCDFDGDVEGIMADCDITIDHTYHMKAYNQAMMEPFICYTKS